MIIVPDRFNVIAKEPMRNGKVTAGMKGFFAENTPQIVRVNNTLFQECTNEFISRLMELYAQFAVMWENDPRLVTLHTTRDDPRLYFIEV